MTPTDLSVHPNSKCGDVLAGKSFAVWWSICCFQEICGVSIIIFFHSNVKVLQWGPEVRTKDPKMDMERDLWCSNDGIFALSIAAIDPSLSWRLIALHRENEKREKLFHSPKHSTLVLVERVFPSREIHFDETQCGCGWKKEDFGCFTCATSTS